MANFNKVILLGNLTRDPMLKYLPSGSAVCEFGLAVNRNWTDPSGEKREAATFVDCRAMGKPAEIINQYMRKGRALMVEGRLEYRQWEKDGQKRSKLDVFVEGFQFIGGRREDGDGGPPQGGDRPAGAARAAARPVRNAPTLGAEGNPEEPRTGSTPPFDSFAAGDSGDDDVPF